MSRLRLQFYLASLKSAFASLTHASRLRLRFYSAFGLGSAFGLNIVLASLALCLPWLASLAAAKKKVAKARRARKGSQGPDSYQLPPSYRIANS